MGAGGAPGPSRRGARPLRSGDRQPLPDGLTASKVIAVHLNYASRAAQRGRTPTEPSYFLKPPSSLSPGGAVVRPRGAQLLAFEGEIALIVSRRARHVTLERAAEHIGHYAAANDFGAHDFRWADRGSNLLSKGQDGYTPLGPAIPAAGIDPTRLTLTTTVNGELRQRGSGEELLFGFARLVADLSRFMTLEPGDVILTGTPAGAGVVGPGDVVEVTVEAGPQRSGSSGASDPAAAAAARGRRAAGRAAPAISRVTSTIVEAERELAPYGAMPRATAEARAHATGVNGPRPAQLSDAALRALRRVSTATLTVQLARRGIQTTFLSGLRPTRPDLRMVGYARTLRYVAVRADVRESIRGAADAQKRIVESISPLDVLVMEARGVESAGTIGDILAARVLARGGAGIVTDGAVRDTPGVAELPIPTYMRAANAASLWSAHIPMDVDVPVTCAGVLVMPGDVIVGDAEGALVLPAALAEEVAHDALEVERREAFALERVRAGEPIAGLYPLSDERREDYERWLAERAGEEGT
ncbi:MAG TPA: fumarylacetoacetate hydrolase family protein [Solirubrobacteraceae bacterium]|nr:fumarylacetoacetate hydrolase family protein [Solirubrobacteraceae bacterium]